MDGYRLTAANGRTEIVGTAPALKNLALLILQAIDDGYAEFTGELPGDAVISITTTKKWPL